MSDNNGQPPKMPGSIAQSKMAVFTRSQMTPRIQVPGFMAAPSTMYDARSMAPPTMAAPLIQYDARSVAPRSMAAPPTQYDTRFYAPQPLTASTTYDFSISPQTIPVPISMAPPSVKSILVTDHDIEMATRQISMASLAPAEQDEQEKWAQQLLKDNPNCPEDNGWDRVEGGYFCKERGHAIPDELLAEGMGGYYGTASHIWGEWSQLYYPHPTRSGQRIKPDSFQPTGPTKAEWDVMGRSEQKAWKTDKKII